MGDSAGGALAAALSLLSRERGGPHIARQILLMPMLDDRNTNPDPHVSPLAIWSYDDSRTAWPAPGVPVEFHLHPGVPHEFDSIAFEADVSRRAIADRIRVLKSI